MARDECKHCGSHHPGSRGLTYNVCSRCLADWESRRQAEGLPPPSQTEETGG